MYVLPKESTLFQHEYKCKVELHMLLRLTVQQRRNNVFNEEHVLLKGAVRCWDDERTQNVPWPNYMLLIPVTFLASYVAKGRTQRTFRTMA